MRSITRWGLLLLVPLLQACVRFESRPLSAERTLDAFESRTLDRADLGEYLRNNAVAATWPLARWDLPALTLAALFYHPDLDVARAQWAVARGGAKEAAERPNPSIGLGPGYNSSTPSGDVTPWIGTLALALPVETAGKRGYRIAQARQLSRAARLNLAQTAWQVRRRVRASLLDLYSARQAGELAARQQTLQAEAAGLLRQQAEAGEASPFDAGQARMQLAAAELAVQSARQKEAVSRAQLAAAIGVPGKALEGADFAFDALEDLPAAPPESEARRRALLNRADLLGALAEYEASQAALQLEVAKQYPDLELGPGYEYDQGDNKWSIGLTLTLPVFNRNRGAIATATARREEAAARFRALQASAIGAVEQAVAAYRSAREKMAAAQRLVDDVKKRAGTAQALREAGELSRLDVTTLQIEMAAVEKDVLDARIEAMAALGDLEDALQRPSDLPVPPPESSDHPEGNSK